MTRIFTVLLRKSDYYLFWSCSINAKGIGTEILFATIDPFGVARSFWIGPYRNQLKSFDWSNRSSYSLPKVKGLAKPVCRTEMIWV